MGVVRCWLLASATAILMLLAGCAGAASNPASPADTGTDVASSAILPATPEISGPSPSSPTASMSPAATGDPASPATASSTLTTASPQPSALDPIVVEPTQTEVTANVGRKLYFNVGPHPGLWRITSGNEAIVGELSHGEETGEIKTRPGAKALGVGNATVILHNADGHEPLVYKITVIQ